MGRFQRELRSAVAPRAARDLLGTGATRHVLDGPRWRRATRGFYVPTAEVALTPTQRILDAASALPPGAVIGGWAAAFVQGVDLMDGLDDHTLRPRPVPVHLPPGLHRRDSAQLRYHQAREEVASVVVAGLRVTSAVRTAVDLARWAPDVTEAVVALDLLLAAGLVTPAELVAGVEGAGRSRGVVGARRAVALATTGARSPWESRLRMAYVLNLGYPQPLVNPTVLDASGAVVGIPDLLDEEAGLVLEYDGASWTTAARRGGHRDVDQHREDNAREELLERTGLFVTRVDRADLVRHRTQLLHRLRAARTHALARDRTRDRWRVAPREKEVLPLVEASRAARPPSRGRRDVRARSPRPRGAGSPPPGGPSPRR
ncbi:hypothetical protein ACFFOM_06500 [Microlunatus capsulatus]|uniref:Transcriptional regulator, AbiEi antitoxin, Type IV TA system n=1 Tax=Microlunatus capsulatus TaxID=99117 RepID=A0ABS4Z6M4_9ACTN|nr:hypothetical protein [Microlunatus capsulatus]MBP2416367.1 hypothetical protein [Microlunatus capsulatus]